MQSSASQVASNAAKIIKTSLRHHPPYNYPAGLIVIRVIDTACFLPLVPGTRYQGSCLLILYNMIHNRHTAFGLFPKSANGL